MAVAARVEISQNGFDGGGFGAEWPQFVKLKYALRVLIRFAERHISRLKVWQDRAGIARFKFNGIRHAYAIYSLRNRADLIDIKEQMGHASITTTAIYTEVVAEGRTERHRITSPRKNLGKGRYYTVMP